MRHATNASETDTSFKQTTLQQTKQMIEVQNKTNTLETDKSIEEFTQKTFPDKHTIQQLSQKHIQSIEDHSIQMFKETFEIQRNLNNNWPNITNTLDNIQDYVNRILEQTTQIKEILKNKPGATNALKTDTSSKKITFEITIEQLYQKSIQSIQDLSIQMFKETLNIQQNLKNKAPITTHTLNTIKKNAKQILKKTGRIKQILKNMPNATNALQTDATRLKHQTN